MTSEKGGRKEKNQNIQVFVRLRPLNQRERDIKSLGVVEVVNNREVVVRQSQQSAHTKRFTFDRAFPPSSKQVEVYQEVVSPLIEEVLSGYNCTVFAYGQTGTGKTHTMVGEAANDETTWQTDPLAGIIPRALSQLFDELRLSNTEYTVRVSYLELYNEELVDLLSSEDGSKLRIYEDVTRKGANIVNGLEEITVCNKNEVFKIMAQGQERKRVASTLMNAQSSRSHTVFTIVVHMKENSPEGEELVKIGKLNLVDLAGSENISKAGSDNPGKKERARECVNINQSLLTLGRVITALVERHPHIPYRESKLTRILQESLGGRTKTSIIATISPGHKDLEETMSTLEYANRAKNIQNKPEVNQKMTKKAILKDYAEEIDRLKRDLYAAREKNGVYLANETFTEMTLKQEEQRKEIQELLLKKRAMEEERERVRGVFHELRMQLEDKLRATQGALADTKHTLRTTEQNYLEQRELAGARAATERTLAAQAQRLLAAADSAARDAAGLHDAVERRRTVESANRETTRRYREVSSHHRRNVNEHAGDFVAALTRTVDDIANALDSFTTVSTQTHCESKQKLDELVTYTTNVMNKIRTLKDKLSAEIDSTAEAELSQFKRDIEARVEAVTIVLTRISTGLTTSLHRAGVDDLGTSLRAVVEELRQSACVHSSRLRACAWRLQVGSLQAAPRALSAASAARTRQQRHHHHLADHVRERLALIMKDKETTEKYLSEQLASIESEKEEMKSRLEIWADEERKFLEERIQRHIDSECSLLQSKLDTKLKDIEHQRSIFESRTAQSVEWLNSLLQSSQQENEKAEEVLQEFDKELQVCMKDIGVFVEELEQESTTITSDTDRLASDAITVVDKVKTDLQDTLKESEQCLQSIAENNKCLEQVVERSNKMVTSIIQNCNGTMDTAVVEFNSTSMATVTALRQLEAVVRSLEAGTLDHSHAQGASLVELRKVGLHLQAGVERELDALEELEERCLHEEYSVYRPSGATPARREYRYPRTLAATSPEHRVLARLRAAAETDLVPEESETRSGDSSSSEDSCVIMEPSPPVSAPCIVKCTSETDIYLRRRQHEQGKENANRSMTFKKPSKLPAPASHKKPLVDRNADN